MAQEEIKLVGSFKDEITPQLKKLTKQIDAIGRSFSKFNRNLRPISKEFGRMASSARTFNEALAQQNKLMTSSSRAMRDYKSQAGKMSGAMRAIQVQREKAMRTQGMSRQQMRKGGGGGGLPYAPMPAPKAPKMPKASKMPKVAPMAAGGGSKFGASAGQSFAASVGSSAIGTTIGMMASQAIMAGIQGLGKLLAAPFQKFASAFAERIGDEMDDIKSAGGLFALDMDLTQESGNERFFKNYNESLRFQEKLNIDMAKSAAALPGVTSQYVNTSRQLTDTIQMVMEKDREGFSKMAARFGADVSMGGVDASKNAMQTVLKKQTEQVMLQSMGQTGGLPMHIMIQQLMGKEAKNGKLGVQAMTNKFRAAFQKNPLLKNFLLRAEDELAKTEAGSAERLQKVMEVFDAAMPKEVINKMRGSISGMQEALRSGLLDPQAGLFGMSRANMASAEAMAKGMANEAGELLKRNVNDFGEFLFVLNEEAFNEDIAKELNLEANKNLKGQELTLAQLQKLGYNIDKQGKIVDKQGKVVAETSTSTTYLFEQIREILAGFGPVLLEFVGFLPMLFDPFTQMTESLMPLRDQAQEFVSGFNKNIDVFEKVATAMSGSADAAEAGLGATLKGQSRGRAAIGKVVKFLEGVGGIDKELSSNILDTVGDVSKGGIEGYDKKITQFIEPLFRSLIESDLAKSLSKGFGQIVGGIIRTVYDMITGIFSLAEGGAANALVEGFTEGFTGMFADIDGGIGGMMAKINEIIMMVVNKIGEIVVTKIIPMMMQGLMQLIIGGIKSGPIGALIGGGILVALVSGVKGMTMAAWNAAMSLKAAAVSAKAFAMGGKAGLLGQMGPQATSAGTQGMGAAAKAKGFTKQLSGFLLKDVNKLKADRMSNLLKFGPQTGKALNSMTQGVGKAVQAGLKSGLKMGAIGGILKAIVGIFQGKSPLDAISEGLAAAGGSAIGAAIGTIIFPGIGTVIGGAIGGLIADMTPVVDTIKGVLMGFGEAFGAIMSTLGPIFGDLFGIIGDVVGIFTGLFGASDGLGDSFDMVSVAMIAIKVILSPLVQLLNIISMALAGFRLGLAHVNKFITNLNPANLLNQDKQKELDKAIDAAGASYDTAAKRASDWNENVFKGVQAKKAEVKATQEATAAITKITEDTKKITEPEKKAIESGAVGPNYEKIKTETDAQIAALRGGGPKPTEYSSSAAKAAPAAPAAAPSPAAPTAPAAPQNPVPDLSAPIAQVGEATTKVSKATTAVSDVGTTIQALAAPTREVTEAVSAAVPPMTELGPTVESSNTALDTFSSAIEAVPPLVEAALVGAATTAGDAISMAAQGLAQALSSAAASIKNAASASASAAPKIAGIGAESKFDGKGGKMMPLAAAIQKERSMMPTGANLVIANSSETVIPAFNGHQGDGFKNLTFDQMEGAAGFNRMKTYTEQITEIADKTAASFTGAMGGALGGGSATLNAMEALGHSFGLTTTSGNRPGDPGFHGVNRARDLSNGGGETPEMNAAAAKMANEFGSSLTELIYTPLGFSIKNGQKTGLISPDNHYHHIHVAVADGLSKAAVFGSEKAARDFEKANMPTGAEPMRVDLSSMTANSSEFTGGGGGQNLTVGDVHVSVSGTDDPKAIANQVAGEILHALEKATYTELFTS